MKYKRTIIATDYGATYEIECPICGWLSEYNSGNGCMVYISEEEEDKRIAKIKCKQCGTQENQEK